jgi:hypothetical protein
MQILQECWGKTGTLRYILAKPIEPAFPPCWEAPKVLLFPKLGVTACVGVFGGGKGRVEREEIVARNHRSEGSRNVGLRLSLA